MFSAFQKMFVAMAWGSLTCVACAAQQSIVLEHLPPIARRVSAMPRIAHPDKKQRRINAVLARYDQTLRRMLSSCKLDHGPPYWDRIIAASMTGPEFLSFFIQDNYYCGGTHPDNERMSVVFDLRTGAQVNWETLLPSSLTGTVRTENSATSTSSVTLKSARLYKLYLAGYSKPFQEGKDEASCDEIVRDRDPDDPPEMQAWLDATHHGLVIQFETNHATQACVVPVVIPAQVLRAEGASERLLNALESHHGQH